VYVCVIMALQHQHQHQQLRLANGQEFETVTDEDAQADADTDGFSDPSTDYENTSDSKSSSHHTRHISFDMDRNLSLFNTSRQQAQAPGPGPGPGPGPSIGKSSWQISPFHRRTRQAQLRRRRQQKITNNKSFLNHTSAQAPDPALVRSPSPAPAPSPISSHTMSVRRGWSATSAHTHSQAVNSATDDFHMLPNTSIDVDATTTTTATDTLFDTIPMPGLTRAITVAPSNTMEFESGVPSMIIMPPDSTAVSDVESEAGHNLKEISAINIALLRVDAKGELQVLMAQNEVYNYLRSEPLAAQPRIATMPWPGEYRFIGGRKEKIDVSVMDTVVRNLQNLLPGVCLTAADIRTLLFQKNVLKNRKYHFEVYTFVAFAHDNQWLQAIDTVATNDMFEQRRRVYWKAVHDNSFASWSMERRAAEPTRIHQIEWIPIDKAVARLDPERKFVNDWQQHELKKYRVGSRHAASRTFAFLRDLQACRTPREIQARAIETVIQRIATTKNMTQHEWRRELFARSGISNAGFFNLNKMQLLSYNLNILPSGNIFAGTGHDHADERMELFCRSLSSMQYDVIALQEVFASPFLPPCRQRRMLRRLRDMGYVHQVVSKSPSVTDLVWRKRWTDSGLVIASRFPIVDSGGFTYQSRGHHLDAGAAKGAVFAKIQFGERYLLLFNTHLQATHVSDPYSKNIRFSQLIELQRFIKRKRHFNPGCASLIVGDFNIDAIASDNDVFGYSWFENVPETEEYRQMMARLAPDPDTGLVDLLKERYGGQHPSTRPPRLHLPTNIKYMTKHKYPQRLDYMLFIPGSLGEISPIVPNTRVERFYVGKSQSSDRSAASSPRIDSLSTRDEAAIKLSRSSVRMSSTPSSTTAHSDSGDDFRIDSDASDILDNNESDCDSGTEPALAEEKSFPAQRSQRVSSLALHQIPLPAFGLDKSNKSRRRSHSCPRMTTHSTHRHSSNKAANVSHPKLRHRKKNVIIHSLTPRIDSRRKNSRLVQNTNGRMKSAAASRRRSHSITSSNSHRNKDKVGIRRRSRVIASATPNASTASTSTNSNRPRSSGQGTRSRDRRPRGLASISPKLKPSNARPRSASDDFLSYGGLFVLDSVEPQVIEQTDVGTDDVAVQVSGVEARNAIMYVSDHYGIGCTMHSMNTFKWGAQNIHDHDAIRTDMARGHNQRTSILTTLRRLARSCVRWTGLLLLLILIVYSSVLSFRCSTWASGSSVHFWATDHISNFLPVNSALCDHYWTSWYSLMALVAARVMALVQSCIGYAVSALGLDFIGRALLVQLMRIWPMHVAARTNIMGIVPPQWFVADWEFLDFLLLATVTTVLVIVVDPEVRRKLSSYVGIIWHVLRHSNSDIGVISIGEQQSVLLYHSNLLSSSPLVRHSNDETGPLHMAHRFVSPTKASTEAEQVASASPRVGKSPDPILAATVNAQRFLLAPEADDLMRCPIHRSPLSPYSLISACKSAESQHMSSMFHMFLHSVQVHGYRECLGTRNLSLHALGPGSSYEWMTYDQLYRRTRKFGSGLLNLRGVTLRKMARIGILANNRPEWIIADQACAAYALVSVPLYSSSLHSLSQLLADSRVQVIVCSRRWTKHVLRCIQESRQQQREQHQQRQHQRQHQQQHQHQQRQQHKPQQQQRPAAAEDSKTSPSQLQSQQFPQRSWPRYDATNATCSPSWFANINSATRSTGSANVHSESVGVHSHGANGATLDALAAIVQIERIEYDEQQLAENLGVTLIDFNFVETRGAHNNMPLRLPSPNDVATVVYRPRLNGRSVGCVLTHENLMSSVCGMDYALRDSWRSHNQASAMGSSMSHTTAVHDEHAASHISVAHVADEAELFSLARSHVFYSFHPLAQIEQRMMVLYALSKGTAIGFAASENPSGEDLFADMSSLRPRFLCTSPRLLNHLFYTFMRIISSWKPLYRFLFRLMYHYKLKLLEKGKNRSTLWDTMIFRSISKVLGGNLRYILLTGGVVDDRILQFVQICFCCTVVRGMAFPEAGGFVALGHPHSSTEDDSEGATPLNLRDLLASNRQGFPFPSCELKLVPLHEQQQIDRDCSEQGLARALAGSTSEKGELCVRGPSVFRGYLNKPRLTAQNLDANGWWHTGYVCMFYNDGTLGFIGALSSFAEVERGVFVNLTKLERLYKRKCPLIHQIWVHPLGHKVLSRRRAHRPLLGALPRNDASSVWLHGRGESDTSDVDHDAADDDGDDSDEEIEEEDHYGDDGGDYDDDEEEEEDDNYEDDGEDDKDEQEEQQQQQEEQKVTKTAGSTPSFSIASWDDGCDGGGGGDACDHNSEGNSSIGHDDSKSGYRSPFAVAVRRVKSMPMIRDAVDACPNSPDAPLSPAAGHAHPLPQSTSGGGNRRRKMRCKPLVAVVSVNHELLFEWSRKQKIHVYDIREICKLDAARQAVLENLSQAADDLELRNVERIQVVHLVPELFDPSNSLATPDLRLRRIELLDLYRSQVRSMRRAVLPSRKPNRRRLSSMANN
jgi:long-subunit acyl-CoA synthetase (AMP-forming)